MKPSAVTISPTTDITTMMASELRLMNFCVR